MKPYIFVHLALAYVAWLLTTRVHWGLGLILAWVTLWSLDKTAISEFKAGSDK